MFDLDENDDAFIRRLTPEECFYPGKENSPITIDKNFEFRLVVAHREKLSQNTIERLNRDKSPLIRFIMVLRDFLDKNQKDKILEELRRYYKAWMEESSRIMRRDFPFPTITDLLDQYHFSFYGVLLDLPSIPEELVDKLRGLDDENVNTMLNLVELKKPGLPLDDLRKFAKSKDDNIRGFTAQRQDLPDEIILMLAEDKNPRIREVVAERAKKIKKNLKKIKTLSKVEENFENLDDEKLIEIASKNKLTQEIIHKLVNTKNKYVKRIIAMRSDLLKDTIKKLSEDESRWVRETLAENKILDESTIQKLAKDENPSVRKSIAFRNDLNSELIKKLAEDKNIIVRDAIARKENLPDEIIQKFAEDDKFSIRAVIAERKDLSINLIEKLSRDEHRFVRESIASRRDLPNEIILRLENDENSEVRKIIKDYYNKKSN
ncbi:MAG: hypothetical protein EAX96_16060 [Candidatus Lokiarchaeota archaeon]|nr:hypothetical protein [Candidatus Lokiarchaeota archaeon]